VPKGCKDRQQSCNTLGRTARLLVEQNVTRALAIAQRGYLLSEGVIVGLGTADAMLVDPDVRRICLGI
jgi:ABC-type branched-subunit amino acid transport system ATPase component